MSEKVATCIEFTCFEEAVIAKTKTYKDNRNETKKTIERNQRTLLLPDNKVFDFFDVCQEKEKVRSKKIIHPDHYNTKNEGTVSDETVKNRCSFLNLSAIREQSLEQARNEIENDRDMALAFAITALSKLIAMIANAYKIKYNKGKRTPINAKHVCMAFKEIECTVEAAEPYWHIYYGFFDKYELWQSRLEEAILHEMDWKFDKNVMALRGKTKTCCFKTALEAINILRKQLCRYGEKHVGLVLTKKRNKKMINDKNRNQRRIKGVFYSYYVRFVQATKKRKSAEITETENMNTKVGISKKQKKFHLQKKLEKKEIESEEEF
jgi:hypothetical protein